MVWAHLLPVELCLDGLRTESEHTSGGPNGLLLYHNTSILEFCMMADDGLGMISALHDTSLRLPVMICAAARAECPDARSE